MKKINEALPRENSVNQLKRLRKQMKGIDIGDRISDMNKQGANIEYIRNPIDTGIESYEDFQKKNKSFVSSWNLKNIDPFGKKFNESKIHKYTIFDYTLLKPSEYKYYSDKFIGKSIYERIINMIEEFNEIFDNIDFQYIESKFFDLELKYEYFGAYIKPVVFYSNYKNNGDYSGIFFDIESNSLISKIISDIVRPTLFKSHTQDQLRTTNDEIYVTNKKYNCVNYEKVLEYRPDYNVDNFFNGVYKPGISIQIGEYFSNIHKKFSSKEAHNDLKKFINSIKSEFNIENIVYDRQYDVDIYDYTAKIFLK
jgi:hypothetical protein